MEQAPYLGASRPEGITIHCAARWIGKQQCSVDDVKNMRNSCLDPWVWWRLSKTPARHGEGHPFSYPAVPAPSIVSSPSPSASIPAAPTRLERVPGQGLADWREIGRPPQRHDNLAPN
ncbi:hypothetical protein CCMA1212_008877 [Trichoderma ghanense]|uniref:Uncharacterized protein n=1 Tax=Trichoderma ghanense TaxID=65468 RepID=A0ABY2GW68_9HYPO